MNVRGALLCLVLLSSVWGACSPQAIVANRSAYSLDVPSSAVLWIVGEVSDSIVVATQKRLQSCSIQPSLPSGLSLNTSTCVVSGTPSETKVLTTYTVTARYPDRELTQTFQGRAYLPCRNYDASWTPRWANLVAYFSFETNADSSVGGYTAAVGRPAQLTFEDNTSSACYPAATKHLTLPALDANNPNISIAGLGTFFGGRSNYTVSIWIKRGMPEDFWVNPLSFGFGMARFENGGPGASPVNLYTFDLGTIPGGSPANTCTDCLLALGTWYHAVITGDSVSHAIYIDGTQVNSVPITGTLGTSASLFLGQRDNDISMWKGSIDEVGLWEVGLTATEVQTLYEKQRRQFGK